MEPPAVLRLDEPAMQREEDEQQQEEDADGRHVAMVEQGTLRPVERPSGR
jgi:hypothetical protein